MGVVRGVRRRAVAGRCLLSLLLLASAAGAAAETAAAETTSDVRLVAAPARLVAPATAGCLGGLVNDDNSFEVVFGLSRGDGGPTVFDAVMLFRGAHAGRRIDQVCVCWQRLPEVSRTLEHGIVVFRANGRGGAPGDLVAVVDAEARDIETFPTLLTYDLSTHDLRAPARDFYLGVRWNSGPDGEDYRLCLDDSSPPIHRKLGKPVDGADWLDIDEMYALLIEQFPFVSAPRAFGIRADLGAAQEPPPAAATCPIGPCVEDDETICLNDGRFEVKVAFDPPNDADTLTEPARAERLTADTGYFTFFDPNNVEVVVKALAACPVNDHHWVFAGGLTNVLTEITICDKAGGVEKKYTNPQGSSFQPIQDTAAFATCP